MAVRIRVYGKVQGVFYRATTKTVADDLGLTGWVKNEADGSVTIVAEGSKVDELISWSKQGPQFARVDRQDVDEVEVESLESFEIRR